MDGCNQLMLKCRDDYIALAQRARPQVATDAGYTQTDGRKAINHNNNLIMFHPEKPIYEDHFGAGLDFRRFRANKGDFIYI
jgi:hypothetical protein